MQTRGMEELKIRPDVPCTVPGIRTHGGLACLAPPAGALPKSAVCVGILPIIEISEAVSWSCSRRKVWAM